MSSERQQIQKRRRQLQQKIRALSTTPLMRGSLVERVRKCGKPNCVCAVDKNAMHGGKFLTVTLNGKNEALAVRSEDEVSIEKAIAGYGKLWDTINDLTECEFADLRRQVRERRRKRSRRQA
jgi:hypothetical protein